MPCRNIWEENYIFSIFVFSILLQVATAIWSAVHHGITGTFRRRGAASGDCVNTNYTCVSVF